jgi:hypothetical protein
MSDGFKLTEMRFRDGDGRQVVIHVDENGQIVWSGQFDPHGKHVPLERLQKPLPLRVQIGEGKTAVAMGLCCRPDGHGGWICFPGPC